MLVGYVKLRKYVDCFKISNFFYKWQTSKDYFIILFFAQIKIPEKKGDETEKNATEKQKGSKTNSKANPSEESTELLTKLIEATLKEKNYQAIAGALNEYLRTKNEEILQYKWNEDKTKLIFETMNVSMLPMS